MTSVAKRFLRVHWKNREKPLLLGYSGGPDSKALLYALLECGIKPHIAHVDHGWRIESRDEAEAIRNEVASLGCPFLTTRLEPKERSEEEARKGRYAFFLNIMAPFAALLLAHQADDLAETVLKRTLEGAHLAHLGGMQEVSFQYGIELWRPFLRVKRAEILQFLKERECAALDDPSNRDATYLRSRMRSEIFPYLNERFGKETKDNLCLLSERAFELKEYLDQQIQKIPVQKGPWGTLINFNGFEKIEQRHLLQKIAPPLNRDQLETLLHWVQKGKKSKILHLERKKILVDAGRVWIIFENLTNLKSES